jgi:hypothetical protein
VFLSPLSSPEAGGRVQLYNRIRRPHLGHGRCPGVLLPPRPRLFVCAGKRPGEMLIPAVFTI